MPDRADIQWFKDQFQARIEPALRGTPIGVDLVVAIGCQETGHIWPVLRHKGFSVPQILALCVGDTLDADRGRRAFPRTKTDLLAAPDGAAMFAVARQALLDMAQHIGGFQGAAARPDKFCHGFGLFQRDLQFFKRDPQYFLQKRYEQFDQTLAQCLGELQRALKKLRLDDKREALTDHEMAAVGIAYNTGGFIPGKGLRQGHFDGTRFYGQLLFDFIRLSRTVAPSSSSAESSGGGPVLAEPPAGEAGLPPASPLSATGAFFKVDTRTSPLRVRSEPRISTPPGTNVVATLPDGHRVRAVTARISGSSGGGGGFREIETSLAGALLHGFCSNKFLVADPSRDDIEVLQPAPEPPTRGVVAVSMPHRPGRVTRRVDEAGAHSLNEPGQPGRGGTTAEALRTELAGIVDWLAVDKASHRRYQPRAGLTFCNIYAHDYCHLAGAYLPRVWWTAKAIVALSRGDAVRPLIGDTIEEVRANSLFRWLRDFGPAFGWRQTGTLSKLQQEANQGALGLIVARRKQDGRSGHIVMVVPETASHGARRNAAGEVIAPLQSQAGSTNFRYGTGRAGWWNEEQFAESGFWLHA